MPEYTGRPYPRTCICHVWRMARSTVYTSTIPRQDPTRPSGKRGPKTPISDARPLEAIRAVLAACPSYGEGYRKVRARLAQRGLAVCGKWVLRLMRAHGLLAPRSLGHPPAIPLISGRS